MAKRRMGILILLLGILLCLLSGPVLAASTTDANGPIHTDAKCILNIFCGYEETVFDNVQVALYKIAVISKDYQYTLTEEFCHCGVQLNGIRTQGEWNSIRTTLEACILAKGIAAEDVAVTDTEGKATFENLQPGLYLAVIPRVVQEEATYVPASALVTLPGLDSNGQWLYRVALTPKFSLLPPEETDKEVPWKVVLLWRGDQGTGRRPDSMELELFCNGISKETVVLSEENHWIYSWLAKNDGSDWSVIQHNLPPGYTVTMDEKDRTLILINTLVTEDAPEPTPPVTGDTSNIMLYVILMFLSGGILVVLGITGKRNV